MKAFRCPICGGSTEKIWENENKTRFGMRCSEGHNKTGGKSEGSKEYPTILVSSEDFV